MLKISKIRKGFDLVLLPRVDGDWYNAELVAHILAGHGAVVMNSASFIHWTNHPPKPLELADVCFAVSAPKNEVSSNLEFLERCGGSVETNHLEMWITEKYLTAAKKWLSEYVPGERKLVFHPPGGRSRLRRWPSGRNREFVEKLLNATDFSVIVGGGPEDEYCRQEFVSWQHPRLKVALNEFSLNEFAALIKICGYFVGGDSGPMHIAAAVGANTIGIFGPGSEARFRPYSPLSTVLTRREACSPDKVKTFEACCQKCVFDENRCLNELSEDRVLDEVLKTMCPESKQELT